MNVFDELKLGTEVEVLTNMYTPTVGEGAIGIIVVSDPTNNYYEVDFQDGRIFHFRADLIQPT